ncbi:hypothetical protein [Orenia marismortui]|uniref:hypothetical protein n=1 Tax=Orenia marismortui TaxID=46469 RepID=UPI00037B76F8|nr:hypothetical protein [Orenia marismortui]
MLNKLKRFYLSNRVKIKGGSGLFLCVVGAIIVIQNLPSWIFALLIGSGSIFSGVKLFKG